MKKLDRQKAFSGTRDVDPALRLDEKALDAWLSDTIEDFEGPLAISQFKGGQSNPTYRLETPKANYVLRRKPPGDLLPSAHAVDREYKVMSALGAAGFPVPVTHGLCQDDAVIGSMFFVMDEVAGRVFWEPAMPNADKAERSAVYGSMNRTIAELHGYDPETLGLGDFGRVGGYVARQIARWSKQYELSKTEDIPEMDRLIAWLPENLPPENPTRLVHGDFRLDNLIIRSDTPDIAAVLDWELATLGDPVADFTYHCMQWVMPRSDSGAGVGSLKDNDLEAIGIPLLDAYIEAYEDRSGFTVGDRIDFYFAYNFFRIAAILQGIIGRVRDGTAANPNAGAMARQVRPLAETAWRYAERAGS